MARVSEPTCALAAGALWRIDHSIEGNVRINFLITQRMNKSVEESNLGIRVLTVSTFSQPGLPDLLVVMGPNFGMCGRSAWFWFL